MTTELSEADLHIISVALSQLPNTEEVEALIHSRGRLYGIPFPADNPVMALYQKLMGEWDAWAKNSN